MTEQPDLTLDAYVRISRLGDERQRSIGGQIQDCEARIAEIGAAVGEVHDRDKGKSAWNPRVKRPSWDALMQRLESGATGGVVVWDLARFSRRPIEGERLIAAAERGLVVLDSEDEYDLTTANGKKAFRDQLNSAAYESDRLSARTKRGKRVKALNGEPNSSWRPFGFESDRVTVRPSEAAVLRELVGRLLAGEPQYTLVRDLNGRGITTSTGRPWAQVTLRQVLVRPCNAGRITYGDAVVSYIAPPAGPICEQCVHVSCERIRLTPILDAETYERVLAMFAARRLGRPPSETYLCSAIAVCGMCGHALTGRPRKHLAPYPDGEMRRQYWCQPRAHAGGCGRIAIDQRGLDAYVRAFVVRVMADSRHAAALESEARAVGEQRQKIESQISDLEYLADELAGRLGRGEITLRRHDAAVAPLDARLARLRRQLAALNAVPELPSPVAVDASRERWRARWEAASTAERRGYLRQALRGRRLVVAPRELGAPRRFDPGRVQIMA